MPTLTKFRILGIHLLGAIGGVYMAQGIAVILGWLLPEARVPAFIILSAFFVVCEICMAIHELHHGPLSTGVIIFDFMPFLLLGAGVSLFLGRLADRWFGSDWGGVVIFYGVYFCILTVIAGVKQLVQDRNLEEDLKHPREGNAEDDAREHRKYMHPYI